MSYRIFQSSQIRTAMNFACARRYTARLVIGPLTWSSHMAPAQLYRNVRNKGLSLKNRLGSLERSVMAAVFLIVALFANSGKAGFGAYSLSVVQKKVIEQGEFDYVDVPTTFGQLVERSSLIVRVRVSAAAEKGYKITGAHSPAVRTDVLGVVLEVFKAD